MAAAVAVAYARTLDVPFTFDDVLNITDEPDLHLIRLELDGLRRAAGGFPTGRWLARLTLALNYLAGGLEPAGYHLVNVAWHLLASLLAGLLCLEVLWRLPTGRGVVPEARGRTALVAALLFAVHPIQTQAVTYVVQRMTSMGGAFGLLACWLYLRARRDGARARPLLAGAAAAAYLAFACKETYLVLPLLALVLEWLLVPGLAARLRARWRLVLAGVLLATALGAALLWRYAGVIAAEHQRFGISLADRLLSQGAILLHYLSLLALPLPGRLHLDYYWPPARGLLDPPTTLAALLLVAGLAAGALALRRRAPLVTLAAAWFLAGLSLEQSVLPIDLVFEHRLYLPALGLFLLAAVWLERTAALLPGPRGRAAALVAAPVVALLAAGAVARNETWRNPVALYADEAGSGPGASRGLVTLGMQLHRAGRLDEGKAVLRRALALEPENLGARVNLANVLCAQGDLAGAEALYRETTELGPGWATGWRALGIYLLDRGRALEARLALEQAVATGPGDAGAALSLGVARGRTGDAAGALEMYERALRLDPGEPLAWLNRGEHRLTGGDAAGALADGLQALALAPPTAPLLGFLGDAATLQGRAGEARGFYERALALDPANGRARSGLARMAPR